MSDREEDARDAETLTTFRDLRQFERTFSAGDVIFDRGVRGTCMYVVVAGQVEIRAAATGDPTALAILDPGASFGEIALVEEGVRTAAAVAVATPTRIVEIDKARFVYLVSQQPAFALAVVRGLARRVDALTAPSPASGVPP